MVEQVRKRDGRIVPFDPERIRNAIFKAMKAVNQDDPVLADSLTNQVIAELKRKYKPWETVDVESIQDVVEKILVRNDLYEVVKAYILYRDQRRRVREARTTAEFAEKLINEYIGQIDWRVKENSNTTYSFPGLLLHSATTLVAHYVLTHIYPPEVAKAHKEGDFHIHDLGFGIVGYCAGWSLRQLILEGFNGVPGRVHCIPAKHLDSITWNMINFLGVLQNEWAGAQAFSSFDTYLAPFVRADNLDYKRVKQIIQGFVFNMNIPSRWGGQAPFVNITLDWNPPEDLKDQPAIVGGKEMDYTYGELQEEMYLINKAFLEIMIEGDGKGRVFTFPIPTYNITKDFDWNSELAELLWEATSKYGIPYFQNFVNSDLKPGDVRSMCCRLQLDLRELRNKGGGGLFGAGEMTGSVGVVTINMPRIGYLSKNEDEFLERLEKLMEIAKTSLEIKRKVVQHHIDIGLMPYTKRYLGTLANHFSTIGLVGMNEACLNLLGEGIYTKEGQKFAIKVLDFMRNKLAEFQEETGNLYNLEATPAESTAYRLARIDKRKYPDIITANEDAVQKGGEPYYTNSTQLPVNYTSDLFEALKHQEPLQTRYTGGTVFHAYLGERIYDNEITKELIRKMVYGFRIPYYTISPIFSICPVHGYIPGEHETCPY